MVLACGFGRVECETKRDRREDGGQGSAQRERNREREGYSWRREARVSRIPIEWRARRRGFTSTGKARNRPLYFYRRVIHLTRYLRIGCSGKWRCLLALASRSLSRIDRINGSAIRACRRSIISGLCQSVLAKISRLSAINKLVLFSSSIRLSRDADFLSFLPCRHA